MAKQKFAAGNRFREYTSDDNYRPHLDGYLWRAFGTKKIVINIVGNAFANKLASKIPSAKS